jgi:hypothetical protein
MLFKLDKIVTDGVDDIFMFMTNGLSKSLLNPLEEMVYLPE